MYGSQFKWGLFLLLTLSVTAPAYGTNGLNLIGFGTESLGLGGADLAIARDTSALNTNPAGLAKINNQALDLNFSGAIGNIVHSDQFGNEVKNSRDSLAYGGFGYATRFKQLPLTIGIGMFAQGGTGVEYQDVQTAFGTQDDMKNLTRIARLNLGLGYEVNESFALGLSLLTVYTDAEQDFFPATSFFNLSQPSASFFGSSIRGAEDISFGYKLGLQYRPSPEITWGISYTSPVSLKLEGGTLVSNQSSIGLGHVTYQNLILEGADQPQELGIGLAWQASPDWLLAFELNWINWSDAFHQSRLTASQPNNAGAQAVIQITNNHNWRDQYVMSIGAAYQWNEAMILRAGYNYGRNPIPNETLSPLLAPITEHHLLAGFSYRHNKNWSSEFVFQYDLPAEATYTNPSLPFGSNTQIETEFYSIHYSALRRW